MYPKVAEVQGLYGPFSLSERVIQKIWLRRYFTTENLKTVSGKRLVVSDPGRWNFQEGPDFKEARLILDGVERVGDVEVHFNLSDWWHHKHNKDKNFDRVVLHVVLYLDRANPIHPAQTSKGQTPELLHLMPLLKQDLESYAMEDALLELEQPNELEWVSQFIDRPLEDRLRILEQRARVRWQQKLTFARQRLEDGCWEGACHRYALEVLGYKRNRTPMLRLAAKYPLARMRENMGACRTSDVEHRTFNGKQRIEEFKKSENEVFDASHLYSETMADWKLSGLRPANHPYYRLEQYLELVRRQPYWPQELKMCLEMFPSEGAGFTTAAFRKVVRLSKLRTAINESVFCSLIGTTRLNTLIVDAVLPLATVAGLLDGVDYWLHWFPGDYPDALQRFLKQVDVINRQRPLSNGLIQGALGLFLDKGV